MEGWRGDGKEEVEEEEWVEEEGWVEGKRGEGVRRGWKGEGEQGAMGVVKCMGNGDRLWREGVRETDEGREGRGKRDGRRKEERGKGDGRRNGEKG